MATRIAIDPVTRIEGHLRIELEADESGLVSAAYASGTMVRGLERILVGRDPRSAWAIAQRACGVCTLVHGLASVRAVEDALGIVIPPAAQAIRNLMLAQQFVHDHVMHFYHLHALDWVNARGALAADPAATAALQQSLSPWPSSGVEHFQSVQDRLRSILESDRPSVFAAADWDHPGYVLPAEVDLLAVAHYFEALDWQAGATVIHTVFGGKNPHPNFVVGGVPLPIDLASGAALNERRLRSVRDSIADLVRFVDQVYVPDVVAIAAYYKDYASIGEGIGNFLCWGDFASANDPQSLLLPRAAILDRDLDRLHVPDPGDQGQVAEDVTRAWYRYRRGGASLHPWRGETDLDYSGPAPPYDLLDVEGAYSWLKAPRWQGRPMEVGPLARVLCLVATGHEETAGLVSDSLGRLGLPFEALYSTLGRTLARAIETAVLVHAMPGMLSELEALIAAGRTDTFEDSLWDVPAWPRRAVGAGLIEAPRGALGHWIVIKEDRIANYQMVVPTTWNASPRDDAGQPGPYEAALSGTRLVRRDDPLEALRTIHSFDPCLACAVH